MDKCLINVANHGWATKKFFRSRFPKTAKTELFTAGKLVGKNVQLNFGENINSGILQKLYWIYFFWNLQSISYTLK